MLRLLWFGKFEDCDGKIHEVHKWFFGVSLDAIHVEVLDFVAEKKDKQDLCLFFTQIEDVIDERN